ncbi:MAG: diacylglycerol kinase family protein [Patescibacteria group bacterium]|nr:diacylglycerol kinase family protein [Patescibacteria group bacterium]
MSDNKYQKILHRIENRAVDLGINGKIERASMLINPEKLILDNIKKGAKTIIAVGNDKTVDKIINIAATEKITVGIIPIGKKNKIAKTLGIPEGSLACDILSQRRVQNLDLIKINNKYYLSNLMINAKNAEIICENEYKINLLKKQGQIYIYNLANKNEIKKMFKLNQNIDNYFNPNDGLLDLVIKPTKQNLISKVLKIIIKNNPDKIKDVSIIPVKKIKINSKNGKPLIINCENDNIVKTFLDVEISSQKLNIIVGKNRKF